MGVGHVTCLSQWGMEESHMFPLALPDAVIMALGVNAPSVWAPEGTHVEPTWILSLEPGPVEALADWLNLNEKTREYRNKCLLLLATKIWVVYYIPCVIANHDTQAFPLDWGFISNPELRFKMVLSTTHTPS